MSGDTRRRGSRVTPQRALPPRRLFVIGGAAAALAILVDRGLRLDLPQPTPPVPTRRAAADEALLVAVVRDLDELLRAWPRATQPRALKDVRSLLSEQRRVLVGRLTNEGVPTEEITGPAPGSTSAPVKRLSPARLAKRLQTLPRAHLEATTSATEGARELLTAAYGGILTAAGLLGEDVGPAAEATGSRTELAERTSPMVYAFEVVAAQSSGAQRERALATLDRLRTLERVVGRAEASSGWALPFKVDDQKSAGRLADVVLDRALAAVADVLPAAPTSQSVDDVARWVAAVQLAAGQWGREPVAFPGTKQP
ncbi:ferritin-like domain-containing protein [Intrasporangium calvum]|uniref:Ferritin-like domain-containing protein n=1 Tax=Intrasporangium calvum TaxID=53358 RepID=A0ABT5GJ85_9MICO|nr:hypothetical protein [Intrasporangium calvum]MDC5698308.1 ferritin-like domain-containing protein [Intrasporangium calvum]